MSQYAIVIEGDGSTNYSAYAPDLPGVVATGDTLEECEAEMREAIEFHIEGLRLSGELVPPATVTSRSSPSRRNPSVNHRRCLRQGWLPPRPGSETTRSVDRERSTEMMSRLHGNVCRSARRSG